MLTHHNIIANSLQVLKAEIRTISWELDSQIGILPFFHIYGLSVVINITLLSGAPCLVMPKFDLEKTCRLVQDHQVTFLYVPPPIILLLSKHPVVEKFDLSSIRFVNSGAAPLSRELVVEVWERLKIGVKQGYGLSETSPVSNTQLVDEWWRFQGSVGRLVAGMQAKVVDAEGRELPRGESGELLLKGPNVFSGYWKKPELDKETFTDDGWFRTGDVVYACPKGHFYVTDRIKELIKYKGFQVPPAELEDKLLGHKDIADVGVVGVWDPERHTEIPRAYIVPRPGVEPSDALAQGIVAWLAERVAPAKRLRGGVRFVDEIPKSQAGKILRRILRDQAKEEQEKGPRAKL
ncbi:AMP-dependent synthetase/ligase [Ophiocordyceps sinensis CO18]|nr:AMP-dependent synthetase/ligase [Ophiocordyceps sinensis CO18]